MPLCLKVDASGNLTIPRDVLPDSGPNSEYVVAVHGDRVQLVPSKSPNVKWHSRTPRQRAEAFLEWAQSHKDGPGLPDSAVGRDGIYED